tara:strand:- start:1399 stop:1533 length:135 start_codon:yes stop_codon:yes gene_type:complete
MAGNIVDSPYFKCIIADGGFKMFTLKLTSEIIRNKEKKRRKKKK